MNNLSVEKRMPLNAREGDFIETFDGSLFDVKGLVHPVNRIIAFPRYFLDEKGERKRRGKAYRKIYSLSTRFRFLQNRYPHFLVHDPVFDEKLCEVPLDAITKHFRPVKILHNFLISTNLDDLERKAIRLIMLLQRTANIPWNAIGLSGSIMVGLHTRTSDIDPIVYGSQYSKSVYSALKELLMAEASCLKPYTLDDLKVLFEFRSKDTKMTYADFVRSESRKVLQGKYLRTDYFIRFVKGCNELSEHYGDVRYTNVGHAKIKAIIEDDSDSIFTPCVYKINDVQIIEGSKISPIKEIVSFRGRFCEQARKGEVVSAQGKIERVVNTIRDFEYFRLLLGNKPSDYLIAMQS